MNENQPSGSTDNGHSGATNGGGSGPADETFGWTAGEDPAKGGGDARATAERMLAQLQSMIDSLATQAAPVVRQVGAKAAELAAVAAERAGPLAHKAADATADASGKLAERSRTWAAELRNRAEGGPDADPDSGTSVAVDGTDGASEDAARDQPAEGARS